MSPLRALFDLGKRCVCYFMAVCYAVLNSAMLLATFPFCSPDIPEEQSTSSCAASPHMPAHACAGGRRRARAAGARAARPHPAARPRPPAPRRRGPHPPPWAPPTPPSWRPWPPGRLAGMRYDMEYRGKMAVQAPKNVKHTAHNRYCMASCSVISKNTKVNQQKLCHGWLAQFA